MTASVEEALRSALAFNFPELHLPIRQARAIVDACRLRRLNRGATLFAQASATPALYAVASGELEARFIAPDGGVSVIELITPFRLFGLASFASGSPSTYEAVARKSSQVLVIAHAAYDRLMDEVPGFARALLKELAGRHSNTLQLLELARHQPADTRLASALSRVMGVWDVMRDIVNECLAVARAVGVTLPGDPWEGVERIAATMPSQFSSTAQDLARGKRSEIDHLNGFIVRRGEAAGVPTPVNRVLHTLVKLMEGRQTLAG